METWYSSRDVAISLCSNFCAACLHRFGSDRSQKSNSKCGGPMHRHFSTSNILQTNRDTDVIFILPDSPSLVLQLLYLTFVSISLRSIAKVEFKMRIYSGGPTHRHFSTLNISRTDWDTDVIFTLPNSPFRLLQLLYLTFASISLRSVTKCDLKRQPSGVRVQHLYNWCFSIWNISGSGQDTDEIFHLFNSALFVLQLL